MNDSQIQEIFKRLQSGEHVDLAPKENVAIKSFFDQAGRAPTANELARAIPYFEGPYGNAYVAELMNREQNSPEKLAEKQKASLEGKIPQYSGSVNNLFKEMLSRDATDAESKHFGGLLASGDVDEYTLRSFLQQTPEYVRPRLEKQDTEYFTNQLTPAIQSDFARRGIQDSSAIGAQFANAAKDLNRERERYVEGIGREDYLREVGRIYGNQDYTRGRTDQLSDYYRQRDKEIQDYGYQRQSYEDFLRRYGKRQKGGLGSLLGGIAGGAAGAYFGGPQGAAAGYGVGSGLGGGIESAFGG
jgi:hypothetical protein